MKVFVGISGGVDSAVAAARLKDAGHDVTGVFIKVWHPDWLVCNWEAERLDAMRVAAHLDIPFLTCDAEAAYRDEVAEQFIAAYTRGETPNPDVLCNQHVKFGAFLQFAKAHGAEAIATGHYARRSDTPSGPQLLRGTDPQKDQSYFLWALTSNQLSRALLPIGDTPKAMIRSEALARKLPVAQKRDSQGICFLGHIDIKEFLSHYVTLSPGDVLDEQGRVVGTHAGALTYTLGQRHGFTHTGGTTPHYVIAKDISNNTITVSNAPLTQEQQQTITLHSAVFRDDVSVGDTFSADLRYHDNNPAQVTIAAMNEKTVSITLNTPHEAISPGQSCVLYRGDVCIGGGIIMS